MEIQVPKRHQNYLKYYLRLYSTVSPVYTLIDDDGTTVTYDITGVLLTPTQSQYDIVVSECDARLRQKLKQDVLDAHATYSKVKLHYAVVNSDIIAQGTILEFDWEISEAHKILGNKFMNGDYFEYNIPNTSFTVINIPKYIAEYFCRIIEIFRTRLTVYRYDLYTSIDLMTGDELSRFNPLDTVLINDAKFVFDITNTPELNLNEALESMTISDKSTYLLELPESEWCKVVKTLG